MRSSHFRSIGAMLLALGLTACGGKATFDVSGVITGLSFNHLVLANGSDTVSPVANATSFTFPHQIDYGTAFNIVVQTPPDHQACVVTGGTGSAGHTAAIAATLTCVTNALALSGTVTGLTGTGLVLINGSVLAPVSVAPVTPTADVPFAFANVTYGNTYGVTVVDPSGQHCTVQNGSGTMTDAGVTNVLVTCVAVTPPP